MKTKDLKFDYIGNVHAITRCLLADYISKRVKTFIFNKGFNSFGSISYIADLVTSYNEISGFPFYIPLKHFIK